MTVEELIEKLKLCRPTALVQLEGTNSDGGELIEVISRVEEQAEWAMKPRVILS